jgi:hypothetical protein
MGFENELIGQSNFPLGHVGEKPSRGWLFLPAGSLKDVLEIPSRTRRLRARICRQRPGLRKVESWADGGARTRRIRQKSNCRRAEFTGVRAGASSLAESSH